jgi:acyl-coenzyme A synthetase/AMP-(fatty) acid ligase
VTEEFGVGEDDQLASPGGPLHLDLSGLDIFVAAKSRPHRRRWLGSSSGNALPALRTIFFANEVFPSPHLRRPTSAGARGDPIGRALADADLVAVTDAGRLTATDEVGNSGFAGRPSCMAPRDNEDRTAEGLADSSSNVAGPFYRRGDLLRRDDNGDNWLVERRDTHVKSHGSRIELADVESAIHAKRALLERGATRPGAGKRLVAVAPVSAGTIGRDLSRASA